MHQKMDVLILFYFKCPKWAFFWKKKKSYRKSNFDHFVVFVFSSPKNVSLKKMYHNISLPWVLAFFLPKHLFCVSHRETCWTMSVDNVGLNICLSEILNSMVTLTSFPWHKPKWSRDEFNSQSQIFQGLGTTSWFMV